MKERKRDTAEEAAKGLPVFMLPFFFNNRTPF
jgi:hypothetical protein